MPSRAENNPQDATQQDTTPGVPLNINLQYTKDLSFEVPHGATIFTTLRTPPQVSVDIDVKVNALEENSPVFEVALALRAEAVEGEDSTEPGRKVFIAELTYAAIATLDNPPEDVIEPILLVEIPRLLFPFARAIISDVTRDGGFPPVVLQPIDFVALWHAKRAQGFSQTEGEA